MNATASKLPTTIDAGGVKFQTVDWGGLNGARVCLPGGAVATPPLGASTEGAQEKVAVQIAHQVADALKGRGYFGVVNASVMTSGDLPS